MGRVLTGQDIYGFKLYHVYFTGVKDFGLEDNFLLTYNGKKAPKLEELVAGGHKGSLFLDSGAYPASKKHQDLDVDDYIAFLNEWGDHFDALAQMDYIPRIQDGTKEQQVEKSSRLTWERFEYMWYKIRPELRPKLIYIIHEEDTETLLTRALQWRDTNGKGIEYMGLGLSTTDMAYRWTQLETATKVFKRFNYQGKVHGFGLQTLDVIQSCPYLTSSDSSSAIKDMATGGVYIEGRLVKVADDTAIHHRSALSKKRRKLIQEPLRERAERFGIDFEEAKTIPYKRYLWGCRERSYHIENNYYKHEVRPRGNLLKLK